VLVSCIPGFIHYNWHIVESGTKHQKNWSPCYQL
jgi:hypothetical protein